MRSVVIALLILSMPAYGSHHREHATSFIDPMFVHFAQLKKNLSKYEGECGASKDTDVIFSYTERMEFDLINARALVVSGNLDVARRILTQPNISGQQSIAKRMVGLLQRAKNLRCGDNSPILARIALAWQSLDEAIWHVNDAIREEVYSDPEFICSGPNNHC